MTPFDNFLKLFVRTWRLDMMILAKIGVVVFLFLFLIFALTVVKQVKVMSKTLNGALEKELMIGAIGLVSLAIMVLVMAMVIL